MILFINSSLIFEVNLTVLLESTSYGLTLLLYLVVREVQNAAVGQASKLLPPRHPGTGHARGDQGPRH